MEAKATIQKNLLHSQKIATKNNTMKKLLILLLIVPVLGFGQTFKDLMKINSQELFIKYLKKNEYVLRTSADTIVTMILPIRENYIPIGSLSNKKIKKLKKSNDFHLRDSVFIRNPEGFSLDIKKEDQRVVYVPSRALNTSDFSLSFAYSSYNNEFQNGTAEFHSSSIAFYLKHQKAKYIFDKLIYELKKKCELLDSNSNPDTQIGSNGKAYLCEWENSKKVVNVFYHYANNSGAYGSIIF